MKRSAGGDRGGLHRFLGGPPLAPVVRTAALFGGGLLLLSTVVCVSMFFRQESFVYFPDGTLRATPAAVGLAYEEVRLQTEDGLRLGAWWIAGEHATGAAVLCQGNAGNRSDRLDKALLLHRMGLSVLMFDYRGYGGNAGKPSEVGTYRDAAAAVEHALEVRGVPPGRLILWGESLGGAVAVEEARRRPPGGLVLESTFTSVPAMAGRYYPWLPAGWLMRIRYDSLSKVASIGCPKLFLHGPEDEIVPFSMGEELFAAAASPKVFERLRGGHNDGGIVVSPDAQRRVASFLEGVLGADRAAP